MTHYLDYSLHGLKKKKKKKKKKNGRRGSWKKDERNGCSGVPQLQMGGRAPLLSFGADTRYAYSCKEL